MKNTFFGENLKKLLKGKGLKKADLSRALNIPPPTLTRYEKGNRKPTAEHLISICQFFNVNENWLLTGEGPMQRDNESRLKPSDKGSENMRFEDYVRRYGAEEEIFELDSIISDCQNKVRAMANTIKERLNTRKKASA